MAALTVNTRAMGSYYLTTAAMLLVASPTHADFTATVKCDAKAQPTETFVAVSPTYLGAIKAAIAKAEKEFGEDGCYALNVTPKPEPMFGCNTKYCRRGYGGFKR